MKEVSLLMRTFRKVNNSFLELSEYGKFVYVSLRIIYKEEAEILASINMLSYNVYGSKARITTPMRKGIIEGIHELNEKGIIEIKEVAGSEYILNLSGMKIGNNKEDKYFTVPLEFIRKVVNQRNGISLLNYYLLLLSTINIGSKVGYSSMEYLEEYCGISRQSMHKRNGKLLELGVIEIVKPKKTSDKNGNIVTTSNTYAKIGDRDKAEIKSQENLEKKLKEKNKAINESKKEEVKFEKVPSDYDEVKIPYRDADEVF